MNAHVTVASANRFGEVSSGYIHIMGPLKKGWLLPNAFYPENFDLWADDWQTEFQNRALGTIGPRLGLAYFDLGPSAHVRDDRGPAWCLRITEKAGLLAHFGEVDGNCQWTRMGAILFEERSLSWWEDCEKKMVTIL